MKLKVSVLVLVLAMTIVSVFSVFGITAAAYTSSDIEIEFSNNQVAFVPETNSTGYTFDYSKGMSVKIVGKIADDPDAKSGTVIKLGDEVQNGIYKAGVYDVTVSVTPSSGSGFVYKAFKVTVNKMVVENIRFDEQSVNVEYGDELNPKLLIDDEISQNARIDFVYYKADKSSEIDKPVNVGEYIVKAIIDGDNYSGEAESSLVISKANCGIDVGSPDPIAQYSKAVSEKGGFGIIELLNASIVNADNVKNHELETFVKNGDEYVLQDKILVPGVYEYKLFFKNGDNYDASPVYGTITIEKATVTVTPPSDLQITYSVDMDLVSEIRALLNKNGGFTVKNTADGSVVDDISSENYEITFYDENQTLISNVENCGSFVVEVTLVENDFYASSSSGKTPFSVIRRNIGAEIITYGEQNFEYGTDYDVISKFVIPQKYAATPTFSYKKNIVDDVFEDVAEKPVLPAKYAVVLSIDTENYYGEKTLIFTISKLSFDESLIEVENTEYVYGDEVNIKVTVSGEYGFTEQNIGIRYRILNGDLLDKKPVYAGSYQAIIHIENDIYAQDYTVDFVIRKKRLNVKALSKSVIYGDNLFEKDEAGYLETDFVFDGLVGNDIGSVLSSFVVKAGESSEKNMNLVVGSYPLKVYGNSNPNYEIVDDNSGVLTVTPRVLTVRVSDVRQYVGYQVTPTITVSNCVYNYLPENMALLFETYFATDNVALTSVPTVSGEYDILARVKADNADCQELKNYTLDFVKGKLTLLNNQKSDSSASLILVGKFDENVDFKVNAIKPNGTVLNAVKEVDSKYTVGKLLYVPYTFETVDDSSFVVRIDCSGYDLEKIKIMIAYSTDSFEEVEYTVFGNYAVIRLNTMASYYAVCVEKTLPLIWIIVIAVACVVVVVGLAIFLWIYFTGAAVKAKKNENEDVSLSGAVLRRSDVKSEDDELDELIENFDQSAVVNKEDPAERLKRKEEEQLREQYRLRIRRMRSGGDKTLSDAYSSLGLSADDFDEEKAIDKLIEEDNAKKRKEEELQKQKKKAEQLKKEQETTFVINERRSGELGNTTMPVTPKATDDDDDIIDF